MCCKHISIHYAGLFPFALQCERLVWDVKKIGANELKCWLGLLVKRRIMKSACRSIDGQSVFFFFLRNLACQLCWSVIIFGICLNAFNWQQLELAIFNTQAAYSFQHRQKSSLTNFKSYFVYVNFSYSYSFAMAKVVASSCRIQFFFRSALVKLAKVFRQNSFGIHSYFCLQHIANAIQLCSKYRMA